MTPRLNVLLLFLIVAVGWPFHWLYLENGPASAAPGPLEIAELRRLAVEKRGSAPVSITVERVSHSSRQGNWLAAGTGFARRPVATMAFRLEVPGRSPVLIDTGPDRRRIGTVALENHDPVAQRAVDRAMREASMILVTGARIDQMGGLAALGDQAAADKAVLGKAQVLSARNASGYAWPAHISLAPRFEGDDPVAVAPGIVVIPTAIPEKHNQMIYVRLADGREYLFAGQVAPTAAAWLHQRGRPRLRTDFYLPEDRRKAASWLRTIRALR